MSMNAALNIIRDATFREVLEAFLSIELSKDQYVHSRHEYLQLSSSSEAELVRFARNFADERSDTNPFLIYTVGVRGQSQSWRVEKWVLADVPVDAFFTLGINPSMKDDLVSVEWNLKRFVALATKYPEFELKRSPDVEATRVFGVSQIRSGYDGSVGLVDGSHRVVSMAANGVERVKASVAIMRSR